MGSKVSLENLIDYSFKKYGLNWKNFIHIDKKKIRLNDIKENYANINKLKKDISWRPKYTFKNVINEKFRK